MVDVQEQDQWISHLSDCKQLTEADIKRLCDKVRTRHLHSSAESAFCLHIFALPMHRREKFSSRSRTYSRYDAQSQYVVISTDNS